MITASTTMTERSSTSNDPNTIINDEITNVLQHFQPIPEFVTKSTRPTTTTASGSRPPKRTNKRFTSVSYKLARGGTDTQDGTLKLSFQLDRGVRFRFEITTTSPYQVVCVDHGKDTTPRLVQELNAICSQLSSLALPETPSDYKLSLFAVVSKLLASLNNLQADPLTDAQQTALLRKRIQGANESTRRIWDLQLLLLRCAAVGRERSTFCTPLPEAFRSSNSDPERIYTVSETVSTSHLLQPQRVLHRPEQELMGYLLGLPWAEQGSLSKCTTTQQQGGNVTMKLTLDLEPGDPSPRFARLASTRGTTRVYHGTKMDCAWSILNCGLWSLSDTRFCKNGAIYGNGVYFSTSYKVAHMFASTTGGGPNSKTTHARSFHQAWRHWSTLRLLQLSGPGVLKDYDVSCFPVFEAQIVSAPTHPTAEEKQSCTRRDGNYFVVPNARDIRVTKLHLTFELVKRRLFPIFGLP